MTSLSNKLFCTSKFCYSRRRSGQRDTHVVLNYKTSAVFCFHGHERGKSRLAKICGHEWNPNIQRPLGQQRVRLKQSAPVLRLVGFSVELESALCRMPQANQLVLGSVVITNSVEDAGQERVPDLRLLTLQFLRKVSVEVLLESAQVLHRSIDHLIVFIEQSEVGEVPGVQSLLPKDGFGLKRAQSDASIKVVARPCIP